MINKFKDFLKKFSRKKNSDVSNQDDYPHEETSQKRNIKDKVLQTFSDIRSKINFINIKDLKLPKRMGNISSNQNLFSLSPNISKLIERALSKNAREMIHQVTLVILICSITYTLGKSSALFLKGTPPINSANDFRVSIDLEKDFNSQSLIQVKTINVFRTNTGLGSKKKIADTKCEEAKQNSNLPIKLLNTIVLQDSIKSLASVQVRGDRNLQEVREGDQISNLAKIFKITRLSLLIKNLESGVCESIESDKAKETRSPISIMSESQSRQFRESKKMAGIENEGNKYIISKALIDEKMKDISSILTQARAIKIQNPDGTMAFKLTEMDPQGIFTYLGLQDQDTITSINGKPIYDMNEVMGLFAKIKNLDKLQLGIKREGSDSLLDYNIKK